MKVWTMLLYWRINKRPSLKQFRKFKWVKTSLNLGITRLTRFIIIMGNACIFVSSVLHFLTWRSNLKDTLKSAHCSILPEIKYTETNNSKLQFLKLMDSKILYIARIWVCWASYFWTIRIWNGTWAYFCFTFSVK